MRIVDGCGHPTWHQQFPGKVPLQTSPGGVSGILYAESEDGLNWTKPGLGLISYGEGGTAGCSRVGRGACIQDRAYPACQNGSMGGGEIDRLNLTFPEAVAHCRGKDRCGGFTTAAIASA